MLEQSSGRIQAQDIELRAHSSLLRWSVVVANVFMPWLLTSLLDALFTLSDTKSNQQLMDTLGLGLIGFLVCIIVGHVLIVRRGEVFGVVSGLCLGVFFLGIWYSAGLVHIYMLFFLGFLVLTFTRIVNLYRATALTVPNERMFRTDTYSFIFIFLLLGLAQLGRTNPQTATLDNVLVFLGVCYIALRVWTFWRIQRLETATRGASKLGLALIAVIALFCVLLGPSLGAVLIRTLMAAGALGGIAGAILGLFLGKSKLNPNSSRISNQSHNGIPKTHPAIDLLSHSGVIFIGLLLVVLVILIVLLVRHFKMTNVKEMSKAAIEQPAEPETRRVWIREADGLSFLSVTHPIRRRYQQFIKRARKRGVELKASETPRQFERRLNESMKGEFDRSLTQLYERVRYGGEEQGNPKKS